MSNIYYGGQAVMEGVMMQGPKGKAIACRKEDGTIVYKISSRKSLKEKYKIAGWPIFRGFISFFYSMLSGMQDLTWSAAQAGESEEDKLSTKDIILAVALAMLLVSIFFIGLPVLLATYVHPYVGDFGRSLIEGLLRIAMFLGYVMIIGRMAEIKRLFAYHGAEHKTINALEAGLDLSVANVRQQSPIHTRCGTSFVLMTVILMIVTFTFVGQTETALARIGIKLISMPFVAGLAYELYRLPLYFPNNRLLSLLIAPGLAMQKLTTAEPDDGQIEVAIAAISNVPHFADDYPQTAAQIAQREAILKATAEQLAAKEAAAAGLDTDLAPAKTDDKPADTKPDNTDNPTNQDNPPKPVINEGAAFNQAANILSNPQVNS